MAKIHEVPSDVDASEGSVHVSGPEGVAYSMSPEAASDTSDRLLHSAAKAQGQRIEERRKADEEKARHT